MLNTVVSTAARRPDTAGRGAATVGPRLQPLAGASDSVAYQRTLARALTCSSVDHHDPFGRISVGTYLRSTESPHANRMRCSSCTTFDYQSATHHPFRHFWAPTRIRRTCALTPPTRQIAARQYKDGSSRKRARYQAGRLASQQGSEATRGRKHKSSDVFALPRALVLPYCHKSEAVLWQHKARKDEAVSGNGHRYITLITAPHITLITALRRASL